MVIELREDISIRNIKTFYLQLKEGIKEKSGITLDFTKVRKVDLATAQVIIAAKKKLQAIKKEMSFKSLSPKVKKQLYLAGLVD